MKNGKEVIKIEKGIALPEQRWASQNPLIAVLAKMKDGDSFLYPSRNRWKLSYPAKKAGVVIATRTVDDLTIRVWRVKSFPS